MNNGFMKYAICLTAILFFTAAGVVAENKNTVITNYKYKRNVIPLKQPIVTKSMQSAIAKYNQADYLGAMLEFEKIGKMEHENMYAKYYLALCYTQLGYKEKAKGLYGDVANGAENYALKYYSLRAMNCIEDPLDNEICTPPKKALVPSVKQKIDKPKTEETTGENQAPREEELDDITKFIRSGKTIHPSAMDKITRERMERKIQADDYLRKQQAQDVQQGK